MLNKRPIFIVAYARGGSNILLNLLRSHPDVCTPRGETHEVFKGVRWHRQKPWTILSKRWRYRKILELEGSDIFDIDRWEPRPPFQGESQRLIDESLFRDKLKATARRDNRFKSEGVRYQRSEVAASRILCKNLNGLIFLSPEFARMYPDATFIALVRNGLAVCEGHIRRGFEPAQIAGWYRDGCARILEDAERLPNYHIIRFEDLMADPSGSLRSIYDKAGLDISGLQKVRLEDKPVVLPSGERGLIYNRSKLALLATRFRQKTTYWFDVEEFGSHFRPDVNRNQIKLLKPEQLEIILDKCGPTLERLGYEVDTWTALPRGPRHPSS